VTEEFSAELDILCSDMTTALEKWKKDNLGCAFMILDNKKVVEMLKDEDKHVPCWRRLWKVLCCRGPTRGRVRSKEKGPPLISNPFEDHKL